MSRTAQLTPRKTWAMKFSIFNLLLVVSVTAAIVGVYALRQANVELKKDHQAEVAKYEETVAELNRDIASMRQELGHLTIKERERVYAVRLRNTTANTWSYRVYLPEGRDYYIGAKINSLPLQGKFPSVDNPPGASTISTLADQSIGIGREPGNYLVTLSVKEERGQWHCRLNVRESGDPGDGSTGGFSISDTSGKWPATADWIAAGGVSFQRDFAADEPLLLLDFRAMSGKDQNSASSEHGAIVWVGPSN